MTLPRQWTDDEVNTIVMLYGQGVSRLRIAKQFGTKCGSITSILQNKGVEIRPPYKRKLSPEQETELVRRYLAKAPTANLREVFGVTDQTIRKIIHRHGGSMRLRGGRCREFSSDEVNEMANLWEQGMSQTAIAQRFGSNQTTVSKVLAQRGIKVKHRNAIGELHGRWNGGRTISGNGYTLIRLAHDHRFAAMRSRSGYVLEHRFVMATYLNRPLLPHETVHHINGDKLDNRMENLQLRQGQHGKGVVLRCADCGSQNVMHLEID